MKTGADDVVLLAHGGGGMRTRALIGDVFLRILGNPILDRMDDSACITAGGADLVFTTDSYVVDPVFFPGGDIGRLAACGTINDLAMQGGIPRFMSLGVILEEGVRIRDLETIVRSLGSVLAETGVELVTGDTKVVERGRGGGIFLNTSGVGMRRAGVDVHVSNARPGDVVIVTGPIGDHGIAVLSCREGLRFESEVLSDVAPLSGLIGGLLEAVPAIHCLRDPTRGGLAAGLCDIAESSGVGVRVRERDIPVQQAVRGACRLLGLDPMNVANEGKAIVIVGAEQAEAAVAALRRHPLGRGAVVIGAVTDRPRGRVVLETLAGGERIVEMPSGEDLPRIC